MKKLHFLPLLLITLSGCSEYAVKSPPTINLTKEASLKVGSTILYNFVCGYYGRYSSSMDAPMLYEQFLDNGDFGVELVSRSTFEGKSHSQSGLDLLNGIKDGVAKEVRQGIENNNFHIKTMLNNISAKYKNKNTINNCDEVSAMTRRVFDEYAP